MQPVIRCEAVGDIGEFQAHASKTESEGYSGFRVLRGLGLLGFLGFRGPGVLRVLRV